MNLEYKITQFYDILNDEVEKIRLLNNQLVSVFNNYNYLQLKTSTIRDKDYLKGTMVHFSKMFEVRRVKENSLFYLQSDLAMSMAEYVSRVDFPGFLKLIQLGTLFRDRIDKKPNYRREFQQILSSIWGSSDLYYDAELIYLNYEFLDSLNLFKNIYIEISNINIFNCIDDKLAEKIRFGNGITELENVPLSKQDKDLFVKYYNKNILNLQDIEYMFNYIQNEQIKEQLGLYLQVYNGLKLFFKKDFPIVFSIHNLEGSGHYSGLHYRIYCDDVLVADGGRIDELCTRFDKNKTIPAICMGIGVQMLLGGDKGNENRCVILTTDEFYLKNKDKILKIQDLLLKNDFKSNFIHKKRKNWSKIFKSPIYQDFSYLILDDNLVEIRNLEDERKKELILNLVKKTI